MYAKVNTLSDYGLSQRSGKLRLFKATEMLATPRCVFNRYFLQTGLGPHGLKLKCQAHLHVSVLNDLCVVVDLF